MTAVPIRRTPEEIEALKRGWLQDPCGDIEATEGFEAHHDELRTWREQYEAECTAAEQKRLETAATLRGLSVESIQRIEAAQRVAERRTHDAVRYLVHLFHVAGVKYPDLEADVGNVLYHAALAARAEVRAELEPRLAALEMKLRGDT